MRPLRHQPVEGELTAIDQRSAHADARISPKVIFCGYVVMIVGVILAKKPATVVSWKPVFDVRQTVRGAKRLVVRVFR